MNFTRFKFEMIKQDSYYKIIFIIVDENGRHMAITTRKHYLKDLIDSRLIQSSDEFENKIKQYNGFILMGISFNDSNYAQKFIAEYLEPLETIKALTNNK